MGFEPVKIILIEPWMGYPAECIREVWPSVADELVEKRKIAYYVSTSQTPPPQQEGKSFARPQKDKMIREAAKTKN